MQHTNNEETPSRAKIITNQLIRMSSMHKIMSSVTFTQQQTMQAMVRPLTHSRKQFFVMNSKYIGSLITFTSNTPTSTGHRCDNVNVVESNTHTERDKNTQEIRSSKQAPDSM